MNKKIMLVGAMVILSNVSMAEIEINQAMRDTRSITEINRGIIDSNNESIIEYADEIFEEVATNAEYIDEAREFINKNGRSITENKKYSEKNREGLVETYEAVKENERKVDGHSKAIVKNGGSIAGNNEMIVTNTEKLSRINGKIISNNAEIEVSKDNIGRNESEIRKIKGDMISRNDSTNYVITKNADKIEENTKYSEVNRNKIDSNSKRIDSLDSRVDGLQSEMNKGFAMSAAMTSVDFQSLEVGEMGIGAGIGSYQNAQAVSLGLGVRATENLSMNVKGAMSTGTKQETMVGAGATYKIRVFGS